MKAFLLTFICLSFSLFGTSQVTINEYSASNLHSFQDQFGRTEDWIELHNTSSTSIDIGGLHLTDKESKPTKFKIPQGISIPANGFLVAHCSGRDGLINGELHTNFKLTQTKGSDKVILTDANGIVIESFELDLTFVEQSRCRNTDGSSTWNLCAEPSPGSSNNGTKQYTDYTKKPSFDIEAGFYDGAQTITITNNEENSQLKYTLDGTNPKLSSPTYTAPIVVNKTTVVKAQSFSNDTNVFPGKMEFATYLINENFTTAVFSVAADSVLELAGGEGTIIPIGSIEYFNEDKELEATSFGSLNRHGQDSWVLDHRSLDWISRDEMGYSKAVLAPLFSYSERDEYQKFMFRNSGDDNYPAIDDFDHEGSTHVRDEYVQRLAQLGELKLDLRANERVTVFLNGQYWGLYGMRERPVDHDYTKEYYDQGKYDIQYLSTWQDTEIEYGGQKAQIDWENLRDFILENDMSLEANYEIAKDSLSMKSLIDYMLVNLNVVASDWLNYNTGWWRGLDPEGGHKKWGYILWDLDAVFDYYINYSGVPDTSPNAKPCDLEDISDEMDNFFGGGEVIINEEPEDCNTITNGSSPYPATDSIYIYTISQDDFCCSDTWDDICQNTYNRIKEEGFNMNPESSDVGKHEKIFLKLLEENEEFKQLYYGRYADHMNTVFSCEYMLSVLDSMIAVIEPEMSAQIDRWGGTMTEWEGNVEELKDFITKRCSLLDEGIKECDPELTGPFQVTLMTEPINAGEIEFNTLELKAFPWSGDYFGGMDNKIKAKIFTEFEDEYAFSHWESKAGNIIADVNERKTNIRLDQPDTIVAVFNLPSSIKEADVANIKSKVYPNPSSDNVTLEYTLEEGDFVSIILFNSLGQEVMKFPDSGTRKTSGKHYANLQFQKESLTSGLYYVKIGLESTGKEKLHKISIMH